MVAGSFMPIGGDATTGKQIKDLFTVDNGSFTSGEVSTAADYINIWENGGYSRMYFYSSDAGDAWSDALDGFDETNDEIPAGQGFWFYSRNGDCTLNLVCPY